MPGFTFPGIGETFSACLALGNYISSLGISMQYGKVGRSGRATRLACNTLWGAALTLGRITAVAVHARASFFPNLTPSDQKCDTETTRLRKSLASASTFHPSCSFILPPQGPGIESPPPSLSDRFPGTLALHVVHRGSMRPTGAPDMSGVTALAEPHSNQGFGRHKHRVNEDGPLR